MISRVILSATLLFTSVVAFAQTEEVILPSERKQLTIVTEPFTLYKGFFRVGTALQYAAFYKIFDADGARVPVSNSSGKTWASQVLLQYGFSDRFQVTTALPYQTQRVFLSYRVEAPGLNLFEQQKLEGHGSGLSDLWIGLDYQLLTETTNRPALKGMLTITVPTGAKNPVDTGDPAIFDMPVGAGHYSVDAAFSLRKIVYPYSWTAYVSYKLNMEGTKQFDLGGPEYAFKDGNLLTLSASHSIHMNEWLALTNEVYCFFSGTDIENGQELNDSAGWVTQYSPKISFQINRLRINQAIQLPLIGKLSSADPGFILVVQYVL